MNLKEYKLRLDRHDWWYMMSDDARVYEAGYKEQSELINLARDKKTYWAAFQREQKKHFPRIYNK